MATIEIQVAGRAYPVACRDGEEAHLRSLGAEIDRKAAEAAAAVGNMGEARLLLFASLLLADEINELRAGGPAPDPAPAPAATPAPHPVEPDPQLIASLDRIASRLERIADRLEADGPGT